MPEEKTSKSLKLLCEEARQTIAGHLAAMVAAFVAKATATEPSVPHAKFLVELMQLEPLACGAEGKNCR